MKFQKLIWVFLLVVIFSGEQILTAQQAAVPDTIIAEGRYLMGDRDSKADARDFALLDAKKKILEKAGAFVKSQEIVQNYQLTSQQIESYTLGTIQTETLDEKLIPNGDTFEMLLQVRGVVNPQEISDLLQNMQTETETNTEITELQKNYTSLAAQLDSIKTQGTQSASATTGTNTGSRLKELKHTELMMQFVTEASKKKPALARLQKMARQVPPNTGYHKTVNGFLGIAYFKNNQIKMAIKHLQTALVSPKSRSARRKTRSDRNQISLKQQAMFHFYLARSYQKTGQKRVALKHLRTAQKLNPQNKRYQTKLK